MTVYVNRTGSVASSPNTKEQLCEAVEYLTACVNEYRATLAAIDVAARAAADLFDEIAATVSDVIVTADEDFYDVDGLRDIPDRAVAAAKALRWTGPARALPKETE